MPNSPFIQLPVSVPGSVGPVISVADSRPIFPTSVEAGAYGHWDFSGNSDSLADLTSGRTLSLVGAAPTYFSDSLAIANGGLNGLLTDLDDPAALTVCAVIKLDSTLGANNYEVLFGTSTTVSGDGGSMGFVQQLSNGVWEFALQTRPHSNMSRDSINSTTVAAGGWVFIGWSRSDVPARVQRSPGFFSRTDAPSGGAYAPSSPAKKVSIGSAHYNSATWLNGPRLAEVIIFNSAKTVAEIDAIAANSKIRMQRKGINLLGV